MEKIRIRKRIYVTLSEAENKRIKKLQEAIAEELPDLIRRDQLAHDAMRENTLMGRLRRAINQFPLSPMKIAAKANITWAELDDFMTGEATLQSDVIDRLAKVVKLKLPVVKMKRHRQRAAR